VAEPFFCFRQNQNPAEICPVCGCGNSGIKKPQLLVKLTLIAKSTHPELKRHQRQTD
jgi:hypothetical protein